MFHKLSVCQAGSRDFESVARAWLAHWRPGRSERYMAYVVTRLETDVLPEIGSRAASVITALEFRNVSQKIERRGALEMARRLLQNCGQIVRYGVANDLVPRNPVADIRPSDILKPRKKRNYPVQLKEVVPSDLNARATLEGELQKLSKYGSSDTVVAIHVNQTGMVVYSEIARPELTLGGL